jgi:hypothetical protein
VWGAWVDGAFYFGTETTSRKARNLAANPAVVVHLESGDEAVILEGEATALPDDPTLFKRIGDSYAERYDGYRPEDPAVMYVVRPRVALAWTERDFPTTPTRWRFDV